MKRFTLKAVVVAMMLLISGTSELLACNLSGISLTCQSGTAPNITLCVRVCNGYGRTGTTKGADNDTRSISFGWYKNPNVPAFTITSFLPASITSGRGFSNCTMPGINIGPQGAPYNSQGTVIYVDPGYYGTPPCVTQPYGCVTSTALCGNANQQCITYTFVVNTLPDSVRVYGVEGGGNPIAGCYPDADMKITFVPLPVEWGTVEAIAADNAVRVKWTTVSETNTDLFVVQRALGSDDFSPIGQVNAAGNSTNLLHYEFTDFSPMPGVNRYRLLQMDQDGNTDNSEAVEVNFGGPSGLEWGAVGPNPASSHITLNFFNDRSESMTLSVFDQNGKAVIKKEFQSQVGSNPIDLALSSVDAGVYYVSVQGAGGKLTRKFIKL